MIYIILYYYINTHIYIYCYIDQLSTFIDAILKNSNEQTLKKLKELDLEVFEVEEMMDFMLIILSVIYFLGSTYFMTAPMKSIFFFINIKYINGNI
ncbi:hypothetical protein BCR32DRAFT_83072 [Anaeromyces robustus]|uniref:Uncharacterized protein n=1 Tax=Anaeromyces robustus TaxID=1754192 RepID=A0A1Y1WRS5_9FUNG|nr:hypothetical protein BCR32DRAFT_83072 [Anaeromyces robustus]|eukprot:ORX76251.1 hypothetical protein BCR32DRAFT_83072 [Anaeromyces robustus]